MQHLKLPEGFTEADVLALANKIKARHLNEQKIKSFHDAKTVTVRWDILGAPFGMSYLGVDIPKHIVEDYVINHFRYGDKNG